MKTLGLIGGTSWHSTINYYRIINQSINDYYGDNTNPPLLVFNVNQSKIHQYQRQNQWQKITDIFIKAARHLQLAGAHGLMFCANTPHKIYFEVSGVMDIPILHIADATSKILLSQDIRKAGFIGTKFSMTERFITERLAQNNTQIVVPQKEEEITELHRIIQEELTYGNILPTSKRYVRDVIQSMVRQGAEGVVLGCTEFSLMFTDQEEGIPLFNTMEIHARAGTDFILDLDDV